MPDYLDSGYEGYLDSGYPVVGEAHPFWSTPFEEYTVIEGFMFLLLVAVALAAVYKLFK